jgi:hypothetical protein
MKKIILSLVFIMVFAIGVAMAETTPVPCPESQKVIQGSKGPRGPQGARGPAGPAGPTGEIPWWLLALTGIGGGLFGGVIVLALQQPQAPNNPQPPVNIFNNVVPGGGGQQPLQPPQPPQ